jgi:hypothetical protein
MQIIGPILVEEKIKTKQKMFLSYFGAFGHPKMDPKRYKKSR